MIVKEWKPAEGCKACKDAKRIMDNHMKSHQHTHSLAMKKIKEQADEIVDLEQKIIYLEEQIDMLRDQLYDEKDY